MEELETFEFKLLEAQVQTMFNQWKIDRLRKVLRNEALDPEDEFYGPRYNYDGME